MSSNMYNICQSIPDYPPRTKIKGMQPSKQEVTLRSLMPWDQFCPDAAVSNLCAKVHPKAPPCSHTAHKPLRPPQPLYICKHVQCDPAMARCRSRPTFRHVAHGRFGLQLCCLLLFYCPLLFCPLLPVSISVPPQMVQDIPLQVPSQRLSRFLLGPRHVRCCCS